LRECISLAFATNNVNSVNKKQSTILETEFPRQMVESIITRQYTNNGRRTSQSDDSRAHRQLMNNIILYITTKHNYSQKYATFSVIGTTFAPVSLVVWLRPFCNVTNTQTTSNE